MILIGRIAILAPKLSRKAQIGPWSIKMSNLTLKFLISNSISSILLHCWTVEDPKWLYCRPLIPLPHGVTLSFVSSSVASSPTRLPSPFSVLPEEAPPTDPSSTPGRRGLQPPNLKGSTLGLGGWIGLFKKFLKKLGRKTSSPNDPA